MFARYTVGYNEAEDELLKRVVTRKGLAIGTWVRMVSLEVARADDEKADEKAKKQSKG